MIESKLATRDGLILHCRGFPVTKPRAIICLIHGLGEHSGRYADVIEHFNQADFQVETFDLRGHGLSQGQRGHTPSFDFLMDDISRVVQETVTNNGSQKTVLYGHSFGGNLALNYVLQNQTFPEEPHRVTPDLLITTGPLLEPALAPPIWKIAIGRMMNKLWPSFSLDSGIDPMDLSSDQTIVDAYREDPLNHSRVSARLGIGMLEQGRWALANAASLTTPTLLMHGDADRLTSFKASQSFAQRAGTTCEFRPWPGMKHEIHHEIGSEAVLRSMTDWLTQNL